ncbi:periphilin-1 isoform X4 [Cuculus canorus]|uniref:periphilin-1 isoform X4 n=1 Tax=Cuculus canorus TaxID=55661 RepID=UPI0023AADA0A|nr:periphilin-1 isoform X4 [Cuculus canorus]
MAYRRDEMWSEERYDYERVPRERLPPRIHPDDDYHRVVNVVPKKPPLLERPGDGNYSRYDDYNHAEYRDYDEGRGFAHDRRSGPPHRGNESGYRWPRDDHPISRQPEYRDVRDGFRRKSFYPSHYVRDRSPHKRDSPFFRESPGSRRDSPHSRSGSSVSSRSYSPERSKAYPFHQSQHSRSKERTSVQSLKTSRDASPSGSTAIPSSKALEKSNRLSEKELAEAASKWAAEKSEKADESNLPEITEYDAGSSAPLYVEQTEETETNVMDNTELYEDGHLLGRSKAIATKMKEIEQGSWLTGEVPVDWKLADVVPIYKKRCREDAGNYRPVSLTSVPGKVMEQMILSAIMKHMQENQVYRQDCETFGMVVKMLIDKDPSLEKSIQFALRQNLHEIGERCIEELKHFIAQYDAANQDLSESFKEGSY